ncbi:hypothetical protein RCL1_008946 [Eukaryota sp. TZLM3-RCL]
MEMEDLVSSNSLLELTVKEQKETRIFIENQLTELEAQNSTLISSLNDHIAQNSSVEQHSLTTTTWMFGYYMITESNIE